MWRFLAILTTCSLLFLTVPAAAYAFDIFNNTCSGSASTSTTCQEQQKGKSGGNPLTGSTGLIHKVANIFAIVAGVGAVIVMALGGYHYITAGGDPGKIKAAKSAIIASLLGLIFIALADSIIGYVLSNI